MGGPEFVVKEKDDGKVECVCTLWVERRCEAHILHSWVEEALFKSIYMYM